MRVAGLAASLFCVVLHAAVAAPSLTTLSVFDGADGNSPYGALISDSQGNLFGVTDAGGTDTTDCPLVTAGSINGPTQILAPAGCGVVFELTPKGTAWTRTIIHDFSLTDGAVPGGVLTADKAGNLYGTAGLGGKASSFCPGNRAQGVRPGCGVVFELSPPAAGRKLWTKTILYQFSGKDGAGPNGQLAFDKAGNLYGATADGGTSTVCPTGATKPYPSGCGVVFKLSPPAGGKGIWTETVLHSFGTGKDGQFPRSGIAIDTAGNLYGTTVAGGGSEAACPADTTRKIPAGCGVVFRLSRAGGGWSETILDALAGQPHHPAIPYGGLLLDKAGNIYGTSSAGGSQTATNYLTGEGTVFMLLPPVAPNTVWKETVLHSFGAAGDGVEPSAGLTLDPMGNLYGTTILGGIGFGSVGTAFELSPPAAGKTVWKETVLASFLYTGTNGYGVESQLLRGAKGVLYGTTFTGNSTTKPNTGYGTVFQVTP